MSDQAEIIALCQRPHWIYDHDLWDEVDDVFTDPLAMPTAAEAASAGFDQNTYLSGYRRSRDDVKRGLATFKAGLLTQHLVAGHHVTLDGDTAVCRAHSINIHLPAAKPDGDALLAHGNEYRFDCVRTPAGWRIRGFVAWVLWSRGDESTHDATAKQAAWLASK
ncbi:nuclear transport factor 2 family protein [Amycolatopsis sp. GM8]|uniref:nuclear transport factor 2 family protein n=1 Tax=Amycolatopsis sp. GM8 TaxID=2896530 RepID=UPI001F198D7F|nr:nuclear transport factor 2 family protein [Amycolatopsis sp. GM8]